MKKQGTVKKFFLFQMYECTAVEDYLEEMILQGLMIEEIKGCIFTFHKVEPRKLKFAVDVFEKASVFDTIPTDDTLNYIDYCEAAGWHFIYNTGKIQVFYSEQEDIVDIQTDDLLKLKTINKTVLLQNIFNWFVLPFMGINLILEFIMSISFVLVITSYSFQWMIVMWINLLIFSFINLMNYGHWIISSYLRGKRGETVVYRNISQVRTLNTFRYFSLAISAIFIGISLIYTLINNFSHIKGSLAVGIFAVSVIIIINTIYFRNKNRSRKSNIVFTLIIGIGGALILCSIITTGIFSMFSFIDSNSEEFIYEENGQEIHVYLSHDEVPITLEDFKLEVHEYRDSYANVDQTIFAKLSEFNDIPYVDIQDQESVGIAYSVFESSYDWILDHYLYSHWLDCEYNLKFHEIDSSMWEAKSVYKQDDLNRIIVVYPNKVLVFESDLAYTKEQIELIREKLFLY